MMYAVPRGTAPSVCKSAECRRPVYMVKLSGKARVIDVDVPHGKAPSKLLPGHGALHSTICKALKS